MQLLLSMKVFVSLIAALVIGIYTFVYPQACYGDEMFDTKNLSGSLATTLASNFSQRHRTIYDDVTLSGRYAWTDSIQSIIQLGIVKAFTQDAKLLLKDIILDTSHNQLYVHPQTDIKIRAYGRLFLPTSKESQNKSQMSVLKLGSGLSRDIEEWNFGYELSGSYFFNQYATAKNGSANKHYGMTNTATIGYQFTQEFLVTTIWSLLNFATYQRTPRASFSFVQEINYKVVPQANVSLGLSTGGRQYKNNGKELNLSLFDDKGSEVFIGASYEL